jgi:hypothetical protein
LKLETLIRRGRLGRRGLFRLGLASTAALALGLLTQSGRRVPWRGPPPQLISRAAWGAVPPDQNAREEHGIFDPGANPEGWQVYAAPLAEILRTLVVHHTALPFSDGPREIQRMHMQVRGYADIAYHFLIDEHGHVYEGRDIGVRGSHVGGFNTGTVGVALLGNYDELALREAQLDSLRWLAGSLTERYGLTHLAGHRDFQPGETSCPGRALAAWLPAFAEEMGLRYGTDGYRPPAYK